MTSLCNLFMVVKSLCDTGMKKQVESTEEYPGQEKKMDLIAQLILIKKLVYTGGMNDLNTRHKKLLCI